MSYNSLRTVSVVIPAYNASNTIQQAIATARAQTLRPTQIVVVDDCSKDDTIQKAEAVAGPDLLVVRSPKNGGGGAARNLGIDHSTGDVVAFLDADDLWARNKLANQMTLLRTQTRDSFCFSAVEQVNEYDEKHILPKREPFVGESLADYMLKSGNIMQTSTLMVPRHLLAKCRFNERLRRFQDLDFVLTLGEAGIDRGVLPRAAGRVAQRRQSEARQLESRSGDHADVSRCASAGSRARRSSGSRFAASGRRPVRPAHCAGHGDLALSVFSGALPPPNAVSLLLKHSLGMRNYGALRARLGARS